MKKEKFIQKFVLRTMTNPEIAAISSESEEMMLKWAIELANKSWNAVQAAKQPLVIDHALVALVALAKEAVMLSAGSAGWITIDPDGEVWAFEFKPKFAKIQDYPHSHGWFNASLDGGAWKICVVAPPSDPANECYSIADILNTDNSPENTLVSPKNMENSHRSATR